MLTARYKILSLLLVLLCFGCNSVRNNSDFLPLKEAFQSFERSRDAVFDRLVFVPSKNEIKKGMTFKFRLKDQLGREWMFKGGPQARDGAVAVYRFYQLFDLDTPEIHYKTFTINGKPVEGTIQRFYNNAKDPDPLLDFSALSPSDLDYILKSHLLSWVLANHHVRLNQFLIGSEDDSTPAHFVRIDNSVEWFLVGKDQLTFDYASPFVGDTSGGLGYRKFWRRYFQKIISLDLNSGLALAQEISKIPDDFFLSFFSRGIENKFAFFPNNIGFGVRTNYAPEIFSNLNPNLFSSTLVKRKSTLASDILRFYKQMAEYRDSTQKVTFQSTVNVGEKYKELAQRLNSREQKFRETLAVLEKLPATTQNAIEIKGSYSAHMELLKFFQSIVMVPTMFLDNHAWESVFENLTAMEAQAANDFEKTAIKNLRDNLKEKRNFCFTSREKCYLEFQNLLESMTLYQ